ncbi:muscle M-line assembly protein unc-89-like isoform X2 [Anneissia japonica]|uniref:muscle M-line assembly protein unc-89-like isoform X2 n=1 Tax=Anneissia japonica TaxID=1529436 RepID=UPI00142554C2|nr:muscle M-line assembly protein unc-89-like isoform X2 [Anneissia japonica]
MSTNSEPENQQLEEERSNSAQDKDKENDCSANEVSGADNAVDDMTDKKETEGEQSKENDGNQEEEKTDKITSIHTDNGQSEKADGQDIDSNKNDVSEKKNEELSEKKDNDVSEVSGNKNDSENDDKVTEKGDRDVNEKEKEDSMNQQEMKNEKVKEKNNKAKQPQDKQTYEFISAIVKSSMKDTFVTVLEQLEAVQVSLGQLRHLMKRAEKKNSFEDTADLEEEMPPNKINNTESLATMSTEDSSKTTNTGQETSEVDDQVTHNNEKTTPTSDSYDKPALPGGTSEPTESRHDTSFKQEALVGNNKSDTETEIKTPMISDNQQEAYNNTKEENATSGSKEGAPEEDAESQGINQEALEDKHTSPLNNQSTPEETQTIPGSKPVTSNDNSENLESKLKSRDEKVETQEDNSVKQEETPDDRSGTPGSKPRTPDSKPRISSSTPETPGSKPKAPDNKSKTPETDDIDAEVAETIAQPDDETVQQTNTGKNADSPSPVAHNPQAPPGRRSSRLRGRVKSRCASVNSSSSRNNSAQSVHRQTPSKPSIAKADDGKDDSIERQH